MDGQTPSGFTDSNYTGMAATGPWTPVPGTAVAPSPTPTPNPTPTDNSTPTDIIGGGGTVTTNTQQSTAEPAKKEVKSLIGLFEQAKDVDEFFSLLWENPWVIFVWFSFW